MQYLTDETKGQLLEWFDTLRDNPRSMKPLIISGPVCSGKSVLADVIRETCYAGNPLNIREVYPLIDTGTEPQVRIELQAVEPIHHVRAWIETEVKVLWEFSRNKLRNFYSAAITTTRKRGSVTNQYVAATAFVAKDDDDAMIKGTAEAHRIFPQPKGYKNHFVALVRATIQDGEIDADPTTQEPAANWKGHLPKDKRQAISTPKEPLQ